jgi:glycosyltransferase involved in cell wall biosynthesis
MRLLLVGHISHTGFGVVTQQLGERFLARGLDVRVVAVNHRGEPTPGPLNGRVWPAAIKGDGFGANILPGCIDGSFWSAFDEHDEWRADAVLVVSDFTGFLSHIGNRLHPAWLQVPVFHYMPVEGDNLPPEWGEIWNTPAAHPTVPPDFQKLYEQVAFRPVAMSQYGARVIGDLTGRTIPVIYHGVDTGTFRPVSVVDPLRYGGKTLRTKDDCKRAFGIDPAKKVILRTDRNVIRKFYYVFVQAMTEVVRQRDDVQVVIHCAAIDGADGLNLYQEIARTPRELWGRIGFTNQHDTFRGLSTEGMVALLNAADLYVTTTGGEGFGLTLAESLACEVPVVSTAWAAEVEVVGPGGVLVPPLTDSYGRPVRYHSTYGMDWALPDARAFVQPVLDLLDKPHRRRALGEAGRAHIRRSFDWDRATDQFVALFTEALSSAEVAA